MSLLRLFSRRFQRVDSPQKIRAQRVPLQMAQINTSIQLNDTEKQICDLLDACASHLLAEKGISTSCRIAGGWVRDKLLGAESDDIDVALTDMMGLEFAQHLQEFANSRGVVTGTVGKIAQNPNQSKHLETATLKLFGLDIDLVNLRSEEYASDSRIPTEVTFGTPVQDALRRDITINALFYNVHDRIVEDFTGQGLTDLENGTVRTPLPPQETFLDDPLRVLRCIRFASRYGFKMVPDLLDAITSDEIQDALIAKVTRERVGVEVWKMLKGPDPVHAIQLIHESNLYNAIFRVFPDSLAATMSASPRPSSEALSCALILRTLLEASNKSLPAVHKDVLRKARDDDSHRGQLYLAAALYPFVGITYKEAKKQHITPAVLLSLWESLRLGSQNSTVPAFYSAYTLISNPDLQSKRFQTPSQRVAIGLLLRDKSVHNPHTDTHWTSSILYSLVMDLVKHYHLTSNTFDDGATAVVDQYNTLMARIETLDLNKIVDEPILLNGREVVCLLKAKSGPWTGQVLNKVLEWQLDHPTGTKDECGEWLQREHESGRIVISVVEPVVKKGRKK